MKNTVVRQIYNYKQRLKHCSSESSYAKDIQKRIDILEEYLDNYREYGTRLRCVIRKNYMNEQYPKGCEVIHFDDGSHEYAIIYLHPVKQFKEKN